MQCRVVFITGEQVSVRPSLEMTFSARTCPFPTCQSRGRCVEQYGTGKLTSVIDEVGSLLEGPLAIGCCYHANVSSYLVWQYLCFHFHRSDRDSATRNDCALRKNDDALDGRRAGSLLPALQ